MFETGPNWRRDVALGAVLIAVMIAIPLLGPSRYLLGQLTLFFIWATVVSQWNLVFGVAGIFSLAQMAIFAFGGFATGMMGLYLGISLWFTLVLAGVGSILFSIIIGLACLRLRGPYVALLTLAIAQVMYLLIITDTACFYMEGVTCRNFTGGTRGLAKFGDFGFREMLGRREYLKGDYYLSLFLLVLATVFSFAIIRSPLGFAFRALRDNPEYGVSRGLNRFKYQLLVFAMSAFFTGLAGWRLRRTLPGYRRKCPVASAASLPHLDDGGRRAWASVGADTRCRPGNAGRRGDEGLRRDQEHGLRRADRRHRRAPASGGCGRAGAGVGMGAPATALVAEGSASDSDRPRRYGPARVRSGLGFVAAADVSRRATE